MCLVAEVRRFTDGNGRVARVLMNAELSAAGPQRIDPPYGDSNSPRNFRSAR
jgi:Fic family protein